MSSEGLIYATAYEKAIFWANNVIETQEEKEIIEKMLNNKEELIDAFYQDLEFGTGGMRGIIGLGTNRMNVYTVQIATQGLCNYINKEFKDYPKRVVIAYDSRLNSKELAYATAEVFIANNYETYMFDDITPTPLLSYAIRKLNCVTGVVITASHNPKEYNGYKAYGPDGAQFVIPHDTNIINEINKISCHKSVKRNQNFKNFIKFINNNFIAEYFNDAKKILINSSLIEKHNDIKIVFTPLHGTSYKVLPDIAKLLNLKNFYIVEEQAIPDGNFPTVKNPNPEDHEALSMAINFAKKINADLIIATDPDADRIAISIKHNNDYIIFNGNQTASLITYYILYHYSKNNLLKGNEFVVKTIVTTELLRKICNSFSVKIYDVLTGFKYIAELIKKNEGKQKFICGGEESYGFLISDFVRDKDAISTSIFIIEMACWAKDNNMTLFDLLLNIYEKFGLHYETQFSLTKKGLEGQNEIKNLMQKFRNNKIENIENEKIVIIKDYLLSKEINLIDKKENSISLPQSDVIQFITENETIITIRPSGTEPKIKFYIQLCSKLENKDNYEITLNYLKNKAERLKCFLQSF